MFYQKPMAPIEGHNITLIPLTEEDFPFLIELYGCSQVIEWLDMWGFTEADALERLSDPNQHNFIIVTNTDGERVGATRLHTLEKRHGIGNTTMAIAPEHRHSGYAVEAKLILLKYAFDILGLYKVWGRCYAENTGGRKYNKACGYEEEGVLRAHKMRHGKRHDLIQIGVFRETWLPKWEAYNKKNCSSE